MTTSNEPQVDHPTEHHFEGATVLKPRPGVTQVDKAKLKENLERELRGIEQSITHTQYIIEDEQSRVDRRKQQLETAVRRRNILQEQLSKL